jgi:hypothetical protein
MFAVMTLASSISAFALPEKDAPADKNCGSTNAENASASSPRNAGKTDKDQGQSDNDQGKSEEQMQIEKLLQIDKQMQIERQIQIEKQNMQWLHDLQSISGG